MPTLELTNEQVVELVKQLPPERKREALWVLAGDSTAKRAARLDFAEGQLRRVSAQRGRDWDKMSEEGREAFIDDVIHEDRACAS